MDLEIRIKEDYRVLSQQNHMCFIKDDWLLLASGEMPTFHMKKTGFNGPRSSHYKKKTCG